MDEKRVLIQILNYKTADYTMNLIKELEGISYPNCEILVIDNCSPDNSVSLLREYQKKHNFYLIISKKNEGYAAGNNLGLVYSIKNGFDYTWILNSDLKIIDNNILGVLTGILDNNDSVAGCGPLIVDLDGVKISPYYDRPSFKDLSYGLFSSKRKRKQTATSSYTGPVYRVYGCCMLLKNKIMEDVGLFDERTFLYYEEDILAEKFFKVGKSFYHTSHSQIVHLESMTVRREYKNKNWKKARILQKSFSIYLRDYRKFGFLKTFICKLFHEPLFLFC